MSSQFEDIPRRLFLDSSTLQILQDYGAFLYENEPPSKGSPIYRDAKSIANLEALRLIMQIAERAPFEFALPDNSFAEVHAKGDSRYFQAACREPIAGCPPFAIRVSRGCPQEGAL